MASDVEVLRWEIACLDGARSVRWPDYHELRRALSAAISAMEAPMASRMLTAIGVASDRADAAERERDSARLAEASARERVKALEDGMRGLARAAKYLALATPDKRLRFELERATRIANDLLDTSPPARVSEVPEHHVDDDGDEGCCGDPYGSSR